MKKAFVMIFAVLIPVVLPVSVPAQEKGIPSDFALDPALYVHAVSGSEDTEAWHKWQSIHDEDFVEKNPEENTFSFLPQLEKIRSTCTMASTRRSYSTG